MGFTACWLPLLALCAQPEGTDPYQSALIAAVHHFARDGQLDHLKAILEKNPDLVDSLERFRHDHKPSWPDLFTPLQHAAYFGQEEIAAYLIRRGADVNVASGLGWTSLHLAARRGRLEIVKLLVEHGANVDAKTVAIPERFEVPPSSPKGARPQTFPAVPSRTPLDLAVAEKRTEVVNYLKSLKKQ